MSLEALLVNQGKSQTRTTENASTINAAFQHTVEDVARESACEQRAKNFGAGIGAKAVA